MPPRCPIIELNFVSRLTAHGRNQCRLCRKKKPIISVQTRTKKSIICASIEATSWIIRVTCWQTLVLVVWSKDLNFRLGVPSSQDLNMCMNHCLQLPPSTIAFKKKMRVILIDWLMSAIHRNESWKDCWTRWLALGMQRASTAKVCDEGVDRLPL